MNEIPRSVDMQSLDRSTSGSPSFQSAGQLTSLHDFFLFIIFLNFEKCMRTLTHKKKVEPNPSRLLPRSVSHLFFNIQCLVLIPKTSASNDRAQQLATPCVQRSERARARSTLLRMSPSLYNPRQRRNLG